MRPVRRYPPSTRSATHVDSSTGMSLPTSAWPAAKTSPSTAASRIQRSDVSPARSSSVAMPTQYECMLIASAVAGA